MSSLDAQQELVPTVTLGPLMPHHIDAVLTLERQVHAHPWSRQDFEDVLRNQQPAWQLSHQDALVAYCVAMRGVEETHVLTMAVAPTYQGQGWARTLLETLELWSRTQGAQRVWLEVRVGNTRARHVYGRFGFVAVGHRAGYYPGANGGREDAVVMRLDLPPR